LRAEVENGEIVIKKEPRASLKEESPVMDKPEGPGAAIARAIFARVDQLAAVNGIETFTGRELQQIIEQVCSSPVQAAVSEAPAAPFVRRNDGPEEYIGKGIREQKEQGRQIDLAPYFKEVDSEQVKRAGMREEFERFFNLFSFWAERTDKIFELKMAAKESGIMRGIQLLRSILNCDGAEGKELVLEEIEKCLQAFMGALLRVEFIGADAKRASSRLFSSYLDLDWEIRS
jgi:hypothetical protein